MTLYLLRHAIAVERGTPGYARDSDRPLTAQGKAKMRKLALGMKAIGVEVDVILSSPFLRASETAEIVARVLGARAKLEYSPLLEAGGDPAALIDELARRRKSVNRVMLVGHEPYLGDLISVLVAGNDGCAVTLKKGGLCKLDITSLRYGRCATLELLLAPRQLVKLA